jgi:hypothetical protein
MAAGIDTTIEDTVFSMWFVSILYNERPTGQLPSLDSQLKVRVDG